MYTGLTAVIALRYDSIGYQFIFFIFMIEVFKLNERNECILLVKTGGDHEINGGVQKFHHLRYCASLDSKEIKYF